MEEGAIRKREIPPHLQGRSVRTKDILAWARKELYGQEPALSQEIMQKIKSGEIKEVVLKPKKPGFFLLDGTFIEAFVYAPSFGEDLEEAEARWSVEEEDRAWADEENRLFNKTVVENHPRIGQVMWEHGRRIETYARENDRSPSYLLHFLDRRKPADGYGRHTHQTCLDLYRWQPNLKSSDTLLDWMWERIDAVLRFSTANRIRDHLRSLIDGTDLAKLRDDQLSRLLGTKTRSVDRFLSPEDVSRLDDFRGTIRRLETPDESLIDEAISIVKRGRDRP